ncbi:hypothetical protein ACROYT_G019002 [Oculina patagonica]
MHKNRALLKVSSASKLVEVEEKYIPQIINDPIPNKIEEDNNLKRFHVQRCIALTAELMNGTLVGMRGCFPDSAGQCTNISACNQGNESLPDGVYFERCVAECCTQDRCNKGLFPMLPELPSPSSVRVMVSSSIAGSAKTTQASTTQAPKDPTAAGIKMKAFLHLPIFLLIIIKIMS